MAEVKVKKGGAKVSPSEKIVAQLKKLFESRIAEHNELSKSIETLTHIGDGTSVASVIDEAKATQSLLLAKAYVIKSTAALYGVHFGVANPNEDYLVVKYADYTDDEVSAMVTKLYDKIDNTLNLNKN